MDNQQGNSLQVMDKYIEVVGYSIGALLGDGSVKKYVTWNGERMLTNNNVMIANMDLECVVRVCEEINVLFGGNYTVSSYVNPNKTTMYSLAINNELIYDFFHYFIREKLFLADEIFRASKNARLNFVAGLFDTDGTIVENKNPGSRFGLSWRLGYAARIKTLVEDVTRLLQKLGVKVGKIHEQISGHGTTMYVIKPNIRSFIDSGCFFHVMRKSSRIHKYLDAMKPSETIMSNP